jgi:chromatin remodeling complex protein RSC6
MAARVINIRPGEEITIRCAAENNAGNNLAELLQERMEPEEEEQRGGKKGRKANKTRKNRKADGNGNSQEGGAKKRKQSGFMRYSAEMRKTIGGEDPKMRSDVVAMAREIGKRWRALTDAEKAKY